MNTIHEDVLYQYSLCPLRTYPQPVGLDPTLFAVTKRVVDVALHLSFNNHIPRLHNIHVEFEKQLKNAFPASKKLPFLSDVRGISKRLSDFLMEIDVVLPPSAYSFVTNGVAITGQYAVVQKHGRHAGVSALMLTESTEQWRHMPDVKAIARWLHLRVRETACLNSGVLYLPILSEDRGWRFKDLNEPLARTYLSGIIEGVKAERLYPSPGEHCYTCPTKSCLEVYNVRR